MEIIIHQAILHVLDTTLDAPVLSGSGMEMTAEKTAYLQNHIEAAGQRRDPPVPPTAGLRLPQRAGTQRRLCGPVLPHCGGAV